MELQQHQVSGIALAIGHWSDGILFQANAEVSGYGLVANHPKAGERWAPSGRASGQTFIGAKTRPRTIAADTRMNGEPAQPRRKFTPPGHDCDVLEL
jgi:hypothetical protein